MSALMRLGWPLRVLSDERLRMLARFQTLGDTTGQNRVSAWRINRRLGGGDYRVQAPSGRIYDLPEGLDATQAGLVSADGLARRFYRGQEDAAYTALSSDSMKWTRMEASDVSAIEYDGSWERAVNEQIGKSAPARMVLEGRSDPEIVDWLRNSAEGRQVVSRMARMDTQSIPEWVALIREQVDAYIPTPELKAAALDGAASAAALRAAKADGVIDALPAIHGGVLENMIGGDVMRAWNKAYDKVVTSLGSKPTNRLSRNPTFRQFYEAETIRQIELLDNQGVMLDAADIDRIVGNSRRYALRETRQLLYDLSETSQLGESLRFVSPFYNAFEEVATRWIGLAYDNPAVLGKMGIAFRLLEDQTVEDENGNRFIELRVPEALAKHLPFARVTPTIRIAPERLPGATDLLYNQGPGVGPWVSIPVNEVLKERPELEESVRFMLPFGASGGAVTDFVLPPTARNIWTLRNAYFDPENDERFQATVMRIFRDRVTDWQLNDDDPDWDPVLNEVYSSLWEDSLRDAREFWAMRSISSAVSPVQGQWLSPYQTFMDTFREGSNLYLESPELFKAQYGYDEPDDWFIAEYGPAYWALTESIRRNPEGLAPTIEAREVRDKYGDLLTRFPEFGAAIAGAEDEGEFNRAVYDVDFELRDKDEFMKAPEVGLGWHEYIATRDLIDEALERRQRAGGSLSLNARANQDLRAINTAKLEELFERYPAWQREFEQTDRGKQRVTNEAFREIMTDERLRTRPDWQGVAGYFDDRDAIVAVLRQREAVGLPSSLASHTDLSVLWEAMVTQRRIDNPEFAALWTRWLENDALTASDPVGGM